MRNLLHSKASRAAQRTVAIAAGSRAACRLLVRRPELARHAGHGRARFRLLQDHGSASRRRDPAAELAGDGRRRHRRQCVGHRGDSASGRHLLCGRAAVVGQERQPARERDGQGCADLAAGLPAHRTGRAGRREGSRSAQGRVTDSAGPHRALPDHRGSAVVARRRGEQGQSRCAAGHHRRDLQRGRGPPGQLHRSGAAAGRADDIAGSADQRHHRGGRGFEPLLRNPGAQQGQPGSHARHAARRAGRAEQEPRQHRRRIRRTAAFRGHRQQHPAEDEGRLRRRLQGPLPGHQVAERQRRLPDQGPRVPSDLPVPLQVSAASGAR